MRIGSHEYANEADDDDDDVPKPAQSLGTPVPRQKATTLRQRIQPKCYHLMHRQDFPIF